MNCAYNVGPAQLRRIQDEFIRAYHVLLQKGYRQIFTCDFFTRHKHYLEVVIVAETLHDHVAWQRLVESRLRLLFTGLETPKENDGQVVIQVWPFCRFYDRSTDDVYKSSFYIALRFAQGVNKIDLRDSTSAFLNAVNYWPDRGPGMDLHISHFESQDCDSESISTLSSSEASSFLPSPTKRYRAEQILSS
jgi:poly(A) polymerase Pap1